MDISIKVVIAIILMKTMPIPKRLPFVLKILYVKSDISAINVKSLVTGLFRTLGIVLLGLIIFRTLLLKLPLGQKLPHQARPYLNENTTGPIIHINATNIKTGINHPKSSITTSITHEYFCIRTMIDSDISKLSPFGISSNNKLLMLINKNLSFNNRKDKP
jgi:hypothetical protein